MSRGPELLVRADASATIGLGHVMRSLALAQAWRDAGGDVRFASAQPEAAVERRLADERIDLEPLVAAHPDPRDLLGVEALLERGRRTWIAVDGYRFDEAYRRGLRAAGAAVLSIGEGAAHDPTEVDAVLNQNDPERTPELEAAGVPLAFLGPHYALVRRDLLRWRRDERVPSRARRILLTFGGSDELDLSGRTVRALEALVGLDVELRILAGPLYARRSGLARVLADGPLRGELVPGGAGVGEAFAWADLAVTASGSTCWELCYIGVPMVALVLADNQVPVARTIADSGAGIVLGRHDDVSDEQLVETVGGLIADARARARQAAAGQQLVDGRGADRVAASLLGAA